MIIAALTGTTVGQNIQLSFALDNWHFLENAYLSQSLGVPEYQVHLTGSPCVQFLFPSSVCTTKSDCSVTAAFRQWVCKTMWCCGDENSASIHFPRKHLSGNFIEWKNKLRGQRRSTFSCCLNTSFFLAELILKCFGSLITDDYRYILVRVVSRSKHRF